MKYVGVFVVLSISTVHLHSSYPSPLIASIIDGIKSQYQALSISIYTDIEAQWVMITGSVSTRTPFPGRPVPNPSMLLRFPFAQGNNTYIFEVNFVALHTGPIGGSDFHAWLNTMLPNSGYYICPGIRYEALCSANSSAKSVRKWAFPFNRVDHKNCQLWIPMPKVSTKWSHSPTCKKCTSLFCYLKKETRRKEVITPTRMRKRLSPSSNYPLSRLTPISRTKRLTLKRKKQQNLSKSLKMNGWNVNVGKVTHDELLTLVSKIQHQTSSELENLLREADSRDKGKLSDRFGNRMLKTG